MDQKRGQPGQQNRVTQAILPVQDADLQADSLTERARELQAQQASLPDAGRIETTLATTLATTYSAALAVQVEAKYDQAERIEDKLENLIEQQSSRLQQCRSQQPSLIALPGARSRWQQQLEQQQGTLQRLQGRLETVREIKEGMGTHGPRMEELATRKLRHQEPGLACEWDQLQEAQRMNLTHQRRLKQEKEQLERQMGRAGLSHVLVLAQRPT